MSSPAPVYLNKTVGVLGGGQLGRMLALSAHPLGLRTAVLDPLGESSPAGQVASQAVKGDFKSAQEILAFVDQVKPDVLTVEIEHVNVDALVTVQQTRPQVVIQPSPETIRVIQDKFVQKVHLKSVALASLSLAVIGIKTSWSGKLETTGSPSLSSRWPTTRLRLLQQERSLVIPSW